MGTPEGHQKSIFNTPKVENKTTQKHKKVIETPNQPIEIKKISNKSMFNTSKVKRSQKFVWGLPDGVCRLNPKS
jgi:hypothetical protein